MWRRTLRLLSVAFLVLTLTSGCSLFDDEPDEDEPSADPTLAGPTESLIAPPGSGDPVVVISRTEVCPDHVAGGKADGRFYGTVTMLAGGSLELTTKVENPAKKAPKQRTVEVLVDDAGGFVAVFPVFGEGETLTLSKVEASGLELDAPEATLEVQSLEPGECEALDVPIPPIAEDD